MGNIIHLSTRRNLRFIIYLILYYYLRKIDSIIINYKFKFDDSLIFAILMFLGEFFAGLSVFIYQALYLKKDNKKAYYFGIELIFDKGGMNRRDKIYKIILLIFFAAFFDYMQFIIASFYIPKLFMFSPTASYRFGGIFS